MPVKEESVQFSLVDVVVCYLSLCGTRQGLQIHLLEGDVSKELDKGAKVSRESQLLSLTLLYTGVSEILRASCAVKEMLDQLHLSAQVVQRNLVERLGLKMGRGQYLCSR
jgi:hypothetical protein